MGGNSTISFFLKIHSKRNEADINVFVVFGSRFYLRSERPEQGEYLVNYNVGVRGKLKFIGFVLNKMQNG